MRDRHRLSEAEQAYRNAIEAGEESAWHDLGWLLARQPARWEEAKLAYQEAIQAGHPAASSDLSALLFKQWCRARVLAVMRTLRRPRRTASFTSTDAATSSFMIGRGRLSSVTRQTPPAKRSDRDSEGALARRRKSAVSPVGTLCVAA